MRIILSKLMLLIISLVYISAWASSETGMNDALTRRSHVLQENMGVSFLLNGNNLKITINQKKALFAIPWLKGTAISPDVTQNQIDENPFTILGTTGWYHTIIILQTVFEQVKIDDLHVNVYLETNDNRDGLLLYSFTFTHDLYQKANWSNLYTSSGKIITNAPQFVFSNWYFNKLKHEGMGEKFIHIIKGHEALIQFNSLIFDDAEYSKKFPEKSISFSFGMSSNLNKDNLEITIDQGKAFEEGILMFNKTSNINLTRTDILERPTSTTAMIATMGTHFILQHVYKNTNASKLHVTVNMLVPVSSCLLDSSLCNSNGPKKILLFSFDTDSNQKSNESKYSDWTEYKYSEWFKKQNRIELTKILENYRNFINKSMGVRFTEVGKNSLEIVIEKNRSLNAVPKLQKVKLVNAEITPYEIQHRSTALATEVGIIATQAILRKIYTCSDKKELEVEVYLDDGKESNLVYSFKYNNAFYRRTNWYNARPEALPQIAPDFQYSDWYLNLAQDEPLK